MIAPRYVPFSIDVIAEAEPMSDPRQVSEKLRESIQKRLNLVRGEPDDQERPFGLPVTSRDLAAWIDMSVGVSARSTNPDAAMAFIRYMLRPESVAIWTAKGLERF